MSKSDAPNDSPVAPGSLERRQISFTSASGWQCPYQLPRTHTHTHTHLQIRVPGGMRRSACACDNSVGNSPLFTAAFGAARFLGRSCASRHACRRSMSCRPQHSSSGSRKLNASRVLASSHSKMLVRNSRCQGVAQRPRVVDGFATPLAQREDLRVRHVQKQREAARLKSSISGPTKPSTETSRLDLKERNDATATTMAAKSSGTQWCGRELYTPPPGADSNPFFHS